MILSECRCGYANPKLLPSCRWCSRSLVVPVLIDLTAWTREDFALLRARKSALLACPVEAVDEDLIEGLCLVIDTIQAQAVADLGNEIVFGKEA